MENCELYRFYNCKILRNSEIYRDDLWVRNGKIVDPEKIFYDERITADIKIDCKGALISPGFIDLQINGGFGVDFSSLDDKDTADGVNKVAKYILRYGVTSFCPTIITSSSEKYKQIIPNIKRRAGNGVLGAGILGIHVEGPFISEEKKGAHPVKHLKTFNNDFEDVLNVYGQLNDICLLTMAPELDKEGLIIKELVTRGITVSLGHSNGSLLDGENAFSYGASSITHLFNAMESFHHRDPGLVGLLTSKNLPPTKSVFYGIIADGIHTDPSALRIAYHSNPKGLILVTDAMAAMGFKPGTYSIGETKVEVNGYKAVEAGTDTLCGSVATMDYCIRFLLKSTGCSLVEALECATLHPAQLLNITNSKGTLNFGTDADFVLLDAHTLHVQETYIEGKCVWEKLRGQVVI